MNESKPPGWSNIIEAMYNNFLIRDFVAKVMPALVVISAFLFAISAILELRIELADMNAIKWLLLLGVAWPIGFGIQFFGNRIGLTKELPTKTEIIDLNSNYNLQGNFVDLAHNIELRIKERAGVIKEASGNLLVALHVGAFFLIFGEAFRALSGYQDEEFLAYLCARGIFYLISLIFWLFLTYSLKICHREQVIRETQYMKSIVEYRKSKDGS